MKNLLRGQHEETRTRVRSRVRSPQPGGCCEYFNGFNALRDGRRRGTPILQYKHLCMRAAALPACMVPLCAGARGSTLISSGVAAALAACGRISERRRAQRFRNGSSVSCSGPHIRLTISHARTARRLRDSNASSSAASPCNDACFSTSAPRLLTASRTAARAGVPSTSS